MAGDFANGKLAFFQVEKSLPMPLGFYEVFFSTYMAAVCDILVQDLYYSCYTRNIYFGTDVPEA